MGLIAPRCSHDGSAASPSETGAIRICLAAPANMARVYLGVPPHAVNLPMAAPSARRSYATWRRRATSRLLGTPSEKGAGTRSRGAPIVRACR